jgi:bacteriorhodopsin
VAANDRGYVTQIVVNVCAAVIVIAILAVVGCKRKTFAQALYTVSGRAAEKDRAFQGLIND